VVKVFPQFRSDFRPTTLLVLGEAKDAKGVRWLKLSLPMRPNGRKGWVKAGAMQARPVRRSIVIDLSARKLRVLEGGKTRYATRVAVGRKGMETPTGRNFYLTATFKPTERFLGSYAFETSAYSKLSEWPGGGVVGLHGTSMPWLLGKTVSHGCVRMSNAAALVLKRLTPAGTPLRIVP
jgi:lipoprotein-anchoring transpeptidase ErfK/SrfK